MGKINPPKLHQKIAIDGDFMMEFHALVEFWWSFGGGFVEFQSFGGFFLLQYTIINIRIINLKKLPTNLLTLTI
jgi:hypothetical protein